MKKTALVILVVALALPLSAETWISPFFISPFTVARR